MEYAEPNKGQRKLWVPVAEEIGAQGKSVKICYSCVLQLKQILSYLRGGKIIQIFL